MILASESVDLVICDVMMPDESGLSLVSGCQSDANAPAFLMLTASNSQEFAERALNAGAYGYMFKPFEPRDLRLRVASVLKRHRAESAQLNRAHEETLRRLLIASAFRDCETGSHVRRLGLYAAEMGRLLGWSMSRRVQIRLAAAMHDVGKIGVPDAILLKPGKLAPQEWEQMRGHTEIGYRLLQGTGIPLLEMAAQVAHCHHERWDGAGYPSRLEGEAIPIEARIVAIVDVYDALCHARPYKAAWSDDEALEYMLKRRGRQFDPILLDLFIANRDIMRAIRLENQDRLAENAFALGGAGW